jgi:hypothetical protein
MTSTAQNKFVSATTKTLCISVGFFSLVSQHIFKGNSLFTSHAVGIKFLASLLLEKSLSPGLADDHK